VSRPVAREDRWRPTTALVYSHVEEDGIPPEPCGPLEQAPEGPAGSAARTDRGSRLAGHLTYEEVARVLGRPVGTVKSRSTGLRELHRVIEADWWEGTDRTGS